MNYFKRSDLRQFVQDSMDNYQQLTNYTAMERYLLEDEMGVNYPITARYFFLSNEFNETSCNHNKPNNLYSFHLPGADPRGPRPLRRRQRRRPKRAAFERRDLHHRLRPPQRDPRGSPRECQLLPLECDPALQLPIPWLHPSQTDCRQERLQHRL
jgi:hypothetical protein